MSDAKWKPFVNERDGCYLIIAIPEGATMITLCKTSPNQTVCYLGEDGADFEVLPAGRYEPRPFIKNGLAYNESLLGKIVDHIHSTGEVDPETGELWEDDLYKNYMDSDKNCPTARNSYKTLLDFLQMPYHSRIFQYIGE